MRYSVSKILAHQATRDFVRDTKPPYVVMSFHPVFVLGYSLIQQSADDMDDINDFFWQSIFQEKPSLFNSWVDVRDVADAHIRGIEREVETGTEFVLAAPTVRWEEAADFINETYPDLGCKLKPPFEGWWDVETTAANTILGIEWRSKEVTMKEVIDQQIAIRKNQTPHRVASST